MELIAEMRDSQSAEKRKPSTPELASETVPFVVSIEIIGFTHDDHTAIN